MPGCIGLREKRALSSSSRTLGCRNEEIRMTGSIHLMFTPKATIQGREEGRDISVPVVVSPDQTVDRTMRGKIISI